MIVVGDRYFAGSTWCYQGFGYNYRNDDYGCLGEVRWSRTPGDTRGNGNSARSVERSVQTLRPSRLTRGFTGYLWGASIVPADPLIGVFFAHYLFWWATLSGGSPPAGGMSDGEPQTPRSNPTGNAATTSMVRSLLLMTCVFEISASAVAN